MAKKILFRADGNSTTGLGHLYRLFSLVEMIKDDFDFVFLTKEESTITVIPKEYETLFIAKEITIEKEAKWLASQFIPHKCCIIADGYHFNSAYQEAVKGYGFNLIYVDDLAKEKMFADIVINHSPYLKASNYQKQEHTKLALGTSYALLRPAFLKAAQQKRDVKNIDTAFVCFGGADPFNLSFKAVKALLEIKSIKHIHVVLGGAYKHKDLLELAVTHSKVIAIHKNLSENELVSIMQLSHFAIAPASTILYELCCVKMPILSGFYVDNQELIYKGFLQKNAIYGSGNMETFSASDFKSHIQYILNKDSYKAMLESQALLFDNKIKARHINLIKEVC